MKRFNLTRERQLILIVDGLSRITSKHRLVCLSLLLLSIFCPRLYANTGPILQLVSSSGGGLCTFRIIPDSSYGNPPPAMIGEQETVHWSFFIEWGDGMYDTLIACNPEIRGCSGVKSPIRIYQNGRLDDTFTHQYHQGGSYEVILKSTPVKGSTNEPPEYRKTIHAGNFSSRQVPTNFINSSNRGAIQIYSRRKYAQAKDIATIIVMYRNPTNNPRNADIELEIPPGTRVLNSGLARNYILGSPPVTNLEPTVDSRKIYWSEVLAPDEEHAVFLDLLPVCNSCDINPSTEDSTYEFSVTLSWNEDQLTTAQHLSSMFIGESSLRTYEPSRERNFQWDENPFLPVYAGKDVSKIKIRIKRSRDPNEIVFSPNEIDPGKQLNQLRCRMSFENLGDGEVRDYVAVIPILAKEIFDIASIRNLTYSPRFCGDSIPELPEYTQNLYRHLFYTPEEADALEHGHSKLSLYPHWYLIRKLNPPCNGQDQNYGPSCGYVLTEKGTEGSSGAILFEVKVDSSYDFKPGEIISTKLAVLFDGNLTYADRPGRLVVKRPKRRLPFGFGLKLGGDQSALENPILRQFEGWHAGVSFKSPIRTKLRFLSNSLFWQVEGLIHQHHFVLPDSSLSFRNCMLDFPLQLRIVPNIFGLRVISISAGYIPSLTLSTTLMEKGLDFASYQHACFVDFTLGNIVKRRGISFGGRWINYLRNDSSAISLQNYRTWQLYIHYNI
ncbi:MAG: hypothetical protein AAF206_01820 [Bacteroidota bacterium]